MQRPPFMHPEVAELQRVAAESGNLERGSNIGNQRPMATVPAAGGLVTLDNTQLVSMRVDNPRQWAVTLQQPTIPNGVQPWAQDFDGRTYNPPPGPPVSVFGAPLIPATASGVTSKLQALLRWGAGGVSFLARFDWPMAGGVFGVTADQFDLSVFVDNGGSAQQGIAPAQVPVIGAFMVPGQPSDPTPLRWYDKPPPADIGVGAFADWSVKPYARRVRVISPAPLVGISFLTCNGAGIVYVIGGVARKESAAGAGIDAVVDIAAGAEIVRVFNGDGAVARSINVEWWMGLA